MSKRKAPDDDNPNSDICDFLFELAEYEMKANRKIYKYNAYRKAASTVAKHPTRIKSKEEAQSLPGIGEKIAKKIEEHLQTGKLEKLQKIHDDTKYQGLLTLTRVTGIGPAKARELVDLGITTIEDLERRKDKLNLNHHQLIGLKHVKDFEERIPRNEIAQLEKRIREEIENKDSKYLLTICGSYRRGAASSGDIDCLLTHPKYTSASHKDPEILKTVVDTLKKSGLITDTISWGGTKFMGVCRLNEELPYRRIDMILFPDNQYYTAILYFTGSDQFNRNMRARALEKGFTLNEYSIRTFGSTGVIGEALTVNSERDVFEYIDMEYKEPHERNV